MKKGFTIIELLVVIAIMILILLMAVPIYTGIVDNMNQKLKDTKIQNVLIKGETYASESGKIVFDIKTLIKEGILEPDNELGEYKDPTNGRDMRCDIINAIYNIEEYKVTITPSEECYDESDLENLHGMVELKVTKPDGSEITKVDGWTGEPKVIVNYALKEDYRDYESGIEEILWYGEKELSCNKENLGECKEYSLETSSVLNTEVYLQIKVRVKESIIQNEASVRIQMDHEYPIMIKGSQMVAEGNTNTEKRVQFEISDRGGSGVSGYSVVKKMSDTLSCQGVSYKEASDGLQTEYLENGDYYVCVKDKVGNVIDDEELNRNKEDYLFTVDKVNKDAPTFVGGEEAIKIVTTASGYNNLSPTVTVTARNSEGNTNGLKICVSTEGYLKGCSWQDYGSGNSYSTQVTFSGDYDGSTKTVYVTIQDSYGNTAQRPKTYRVYKYCEQKTDWKEVSNTSSSCPKCGTANYTSTKKTYDKFFGTKECPGTKNDTVKCNIPSNCCESSALVYSAWSGWSACSASCGNNGTQYRTRTATSKYNGQSCPISGSNQRQEQACNRRDCCSADALVYSAWSSWSTCTKTCGGGTQYRTRTATSKYNGQSCSISGTNQRQEQACNTQTCGFVVFDSTTNPFEWKAWSSNNGYGYVGSSSIELSTSATGGGGTSTKYLTTSTSFSVSGYSKMLVEISNEDKNTLDRFTVKLCKGLNTTSSGEYKPSSCTDFKHRNTYALSKETLSNGHLLITYDISSITGDKHLSVVLSTTQTYSISIYSIKLTN